MNKYSKPFLHRLEKPVQFEPIQQDVDNHIYSIQVKVQTEIIDKYDELIFNFLYEEFIKSDATDLVILDQTEFRRFLMKYLPIYMREFEPCTMKENIEDC